MKSFILILFLLAISFYFSFYKSQLSFKNNIESSANVFVANQEDILKSSFSLKNKLTTIDSIKRNGNYSELVIHFWASWCGPCLSELPMLYQYALKVSRQNTKTGFIFVAINDSEDEINKFLNKAKIDRAALGTWLTDNSQESYNVFRVDKIPETYLIRKNNQVSRLIGAQSWR